MSDFVQHLINGLSLGSIYALIALGYTMVFGILQLINFAHGEVYMLGAFAGMYAANYFGFGERPSVFALIGTVAIAMAVCASVGFVIERFAYRPLRGSPRINLLITAVGVSLFLQYTGQLVFGSDPKFFPQIYDPGEFWTFGSNPDSQLIINPVQVIVFCLSLSLMAILQFVILKTRLGRAMRAVSFNHQYASLMGIPTNRIISATFMLGSSLAGAAGVLVGLAYPRIDPLMGSMAGLKAFTAAVLGGIGNVSGAVLGAFTLGLAEALLVGYWTPTYRDALSFTILIIILLFKPQGILGRNQTEKV